MPTKAVVYVSEAAPTVAGDRHSLGSSKLGELVDDAARFNRYAGVSGVLLYDGARFLQYLEGPEDGIGVVYSRVRAATSHSGIVELQRASIGARRFPFWPMRWLPADRGEIGSIVHADWTGIHCRGDSEAMNATGMDLLRKLVHVHLKFA